MKRLRLNLLACVFVVSVAACDSAPTAIESGDVTGLSITGSGVTSVGGTTQLEVVALMDDGSPRVVTDDAGWTTNAPEIAAVRDGLVTGFTAGDAIIAATFGGRSAQLVVSVVSGPVPGGTVVELTLQGVPPSDIGETRQLELTARLADGTTRQATSEAAWKSDDPLVATVSEGQVIAVGPGQTMITAEYGGRSVQTNVSISGTTMPVASLTLTGALDIVIGQNIQLQVTARFTDGSSQLVTNDATWRSSDSAVATVNLGRVTGMARGVTTITATYGDRSAQVTITVSGP